MSRACLILPLVAVWGCTTPNVTPEVEAFSGSATTVAEKIEPDLQAAARTQRRSRLKDAVAQGAPVYRLSAGCQVLETQGPLSLTGEDGGYSAPVCSVEDVFTKPENLTSAELRLLMLRDLLDYVAAIGALAGADAGADTQTAAAGAIAAASGLGRALGTARSIGLADDLETNSAGLAGAAGFIARQSQYQMLRTIVRDSNRTVGLSVKVIIGHFRSGASGKDAYGAAAKALAAAEAAMKDAESAKSPDYPETVRTFERAAYRFQTVEASDPQVALAMIATTHDALDKRLKQNASLEEINALLDDLVELSNLADSLKGG